MSSFYITKQRLTFFNMLYEMSFKAIYRYALPFKPGPEVIQMFMLNSIEYEMYPSQNVEMLTIVSTFHIYYYDK